MSAHKLKPYRLPAVEQLRIGAGQGALGGLRAGAVSAIALIVYPFLLGVIRDAGYSLGGDFIMMVVMTLCAICIAGICGAIAGAIVGLFAGIASYFILTPWISPEAWPELALLLRHGMLVGSLVSTWAGGTLIAVLDHYPAFLPAVWTKNRFETILYVVLLCIIGCIIGGFLNQLRAVVLPSLSKGDWEA